MLPRIITGSLILLVIAFIAIIYHNLPRATFVSNFSSQVPAPQCPEHFFLLEGPIDINTATAADLEAIPRIGPSLAKRIIEFREKNGKFTNIDTLLDINGISHRLLKIIRPYITYDNNDR